MNQYENANYFPDDKELDSTVNSNPNYLYKNPTCNDLDDYKTDFYGNFKDYVNRISTKSTASDIANLDIDLVPENIIRRQMEYCFLIEKAIEMFASDDRFINVLKYGQGHKTAWITNKDNSVVEMNSTMSRNVATRVPVAGIVLTATEISNTKERRVNLVDNFDNFLSYEKNNYNIFPIELHKLMSRALNTAFVEKSLSIATKSLTLGFGDFGLSEYLSGCFTDSVSYAGEKASETTVDVAQGYVQGKIVKKTDDSIYKDTVSDKTKLASVIMHFLAYRLDNNITIKQKIKPVLKTWGNYIWIQNESSYRTIEFWSSIIRYLSRPWDSSKSNKLEYAVDNSLSIEIMRMRLRQELFSVKDCRFDPRVGITEWNKNTIFKSNRTFTNENDNGYLDYYCSIMGFFKTKTLPDDARLASNWNSKIKDATPNLYEKISYNEIKRSNSLIGREKPSMDNLLPKKDMSYLYEKISYNEIKRSNSLIGREKPSMDNLLPNEYHVYSNSIIEYCKFIDTFLAELFKALSIYIIKNKADKSFFTSHGKSGIKRAEHLIKKLASISEQKLSISSDSIESRIKFGLQSKTITIDFLILREIILYMKKAGDYKKYSGSINVNNTSSASYIIEVLYDQSKIVCDNKLLLKKNSLSDFLSKDSIDIFKRVEKTDIESKTSRVNILNYLANFKAPLS